MKELLLLPLLGMGSCGWNAAGSTGCEPLGPTVSLPAVLRESSGVAWSRVRPGVLFSHNDGGHEATIYVLDPGGNLLGEIPLANAPNRDWEDMATGECAEGACIYLADVGDNSEVRDRIVLYRLRDTGVYDGTPTRATSFPMVLPHGPRDMESIFVLPGEEVFFVSKGRSHAVTLYRYPPPLRPNEVVTLEAVQTLTAGRLPAPSQVTGADATVDGTLVAIRTYRALALLKMDGDTLVAVEGGRVNLRTLREDQGEAVGFGPEGQIVLTSEGGKFRTRATMRLLSCERVSSHGG